MSAHKRKLSKSYHTVKYKRRLNRKRKTAKAFKLFFLSFSGLILFSLAFYLYTLTLVLKEPFVKASGSSDFSQKAYDSTTDFNLLFVKIDDIKDDSSKITDLHLYKINPTEPFSLTISIPTQATTEGFSSQPVKVSDLYFLGNAGDEKRGITNLKKYIVKTLAVNVDGYVLYDDKTAKSLEDLGINFDKNNVPSSIHYSSFLKINKIFDLLRANIKSDLSSIEFFKIITDTKNIKSDKYKYIDMTEEDLSNFSYIDDQWHTLNNLDLNVNFRNSVIVLNSTPTKGLALWGARVVKNTGSSIVDVGNFDKEYNETTIYTNDYNSPIVDYLVKTLKIKKIKSTNDFLDDPFLASRADVLLILGRDTASLY